MMVVVSNPTTTTATARTGWYRSGGQSTTRRIRVRRRFGRNSGWERGKTAATAPHATPLIRFGVFRFGLIKMSAHKISSVLVSPMHLRGLTHFSIRRRIIIRISEIVLRTAHPNPNPNASAVLTESCHLDTATTATTAIYVGWYECR